MEKARLDSEDFCFHSYLWQVQLLQSWVLFMCVFVRAFCSGVPLLMQCVSVCLFRCHPILPRGCIFDDPGKARRALRFFSCITVDCGMNHHLTAIYPIWSAPDNIISMLSVFYCGKRLHRTGRLTDTMVWVFARLLLRKIQTAALSPCPCLYYILYSQEHGIQGELAKFELIKTLK